jgi:hypothetical protein
MPTAETLHSEPRTSRLADSGWAVVAAFGAYFCMYGFRKPFTAAGFETAEVSKALLVTAQVLGYATSKCVGIKVISEAPPRRRAALIVALIAASHLALFAFAVAPVWAQPACLFANGLPLGMVFGLVLGFLEGRRHTEALAAGLCVSFIVADGWTKSVGSWLLNAGVTELWMPFVAGLIFAAPLVLFLLMLARIAPPSPTDIADRSERSTMNRAAVALRRWDDGAKVRDLPVPDIEHYRPHLSAVVRTGMSA